MGIRTLVVSVLVLAIASCTGQTSEPTTTAVAEDAATTGPGPLDSGRLVLLDSSGDIVVMDPDGSHRQALTDDAGETAVYTQPIWSPDASTVAWGQLTEEGFAVGIGEPGSGETTEVETSNHPFYMYWSPDGRNLGVLHNGTAGVDFRMVDVAGGTSETLDQDAPFYFSWSPESDRVVTHAGQTRFETLGPDGTRTERDPTGGTYLAPQWTGAGVFHVVDDELVLEHDNGERAQVAEVSGLTMFVANPQGTRVALQTAEDDPAITASSEDFAILTSNTVVVVDVTSGEPQTVSNQLALGFFWSPDGESLLFLGPSGDGVVPTVWSERAGEKGYTQYRPPGTMLQDTFPFFPQYAQSISFWSPDSSAFAFAGLVDGDDGIWVQHLDEDAPTMVSDGVWVAWSPARP